MQPRLGNATGPGAAVAVKWADQPSPVNELDSTAVAESTAEEQSACPSVAGDSIAESSNAESDESETAVAARRAQRVGPIAPQQGDPNIRRESSKWNNEPEVGNFGLFCGNWGQRGTCGNAASRRSRRDTQDRQIQRSPAQVVVLAEAAKEIEELLKQPRSHGNQELEGLERRDSAEHWVIRGNEEKAALLIAARKDVATNLTMLDHEVTNDHPYTEKKVEKMARS